jgi:aspartokinase
MFSALRATSRVRGNDGHEAIDRFTQKSCRTVVRESGNDGHGGTIIVDGIFSAPLCVVFYSRLRENLNARTVSSTQAKRGHAASSFNATQRTLPTRNVKKRPFF